MSQVPQPASRAADTVIAALEAQITSGQLADKAPLPAERQLMQRFGTSRTVIREAIAALASRGLVLTRPRFRPVVQKPTYETALAVVDSVVRQLASDSAGIRSLYESRVFIERGLVRDAALAGNKDDIADLKAALAANAAAIADSRAFYRTDMAFHGVLYRIPKNPVFPAIHQGFTTWLFPYWDRMLRSPERNAANYRAHADIVDAILARDPAAAEAALVRHLEAAWAHVKTTLEADRP